MYKAEMAYIKKETAEQEKIETVKKMADKGYTPEEIEDIVDLDIKKIKEIIQK